MAKVTPDGHIWSLGVQSICLIFVPWQSDHFWLRYSKFHIWPWKFKVKVMAKVKPDGHIWALEFNLYACFSFRGNRTFFGWDMANSIFDLEKSRSRSLQKSTKIWPGNLQVRAKNRAENKRNPKSCSKVIGVDKKLRPSAPYEPVQKHKVTPCIPGWLNEYMPRLKNHLPSRARNHKSLRALGQYLHAPGMPQCRAPARSSTDTMLNFAEKTLPYVYFPYYLFLWTEECFHNDHSDFNLVRVTFMMWTTKSDLV